MKKETLTFTLNVGDGYTRLVRGQVLRTSRIDSWPAKLVELSDGTRRWVNRVDRRWISSETGIRPSFFNGRDANFDSSDLEE